MSEPLSHEEFENYLTLLGHTLRLRSGQTEAIAEELRLHLEERLGELTDRGIDPKKAVNIALGEFGDATALANKFTEISRMKRRRVMMRSMVGGFCVAVAVFATIVAVWPESQTNFLGIAQAEPTATASPDSGRKVPEMSQAERDNQATREKLSKKTSVDFQDRPLNEVAKELNEQLGIQMIFDLNALECLGISSDIPITLKIKDVPAEMVLRLMLDPLESSYYLDNGIVRVTSKEEVENKLSVRMYDVKSLVGDCSSNVLPRVMGGMGGFGGMTASGEWFKTAGGAHTSPSPRNPASGSDAGGEPTATVAPNSGWTPNSAGTPNEASALAVPPRTGTVTTPQPPVAVGIAVEGASVPGMPPIQARTYGVSGYSVPSPCKNDSDRLIEVIQRVVDPESWNEFGGTGSMACFRGILIVRQTDSVHEEVEKFLNQLRIRLKDTPPAGNPWTPCPPGGEPYSTPSNPPVAYPPVAYPSAVTPSRPSLEPNPGSNNPNDPFDQPETGPVPQR